MQWCNPHPPMKPIDAREYQYQMSTKALGTHWYKESTTVPHPYKGGTWYSVLELILN